MKASKEGERNMETKEQVKVFIDTARAWYCQKKTWKDRYEAASPKVKQYLDIIFAHGYGSIVPTARAQYEQISQMVFAPCQDLYKSFTDAEWDEAICLSGNRMGLGMARSKYGKKPQVGPTH